MHEELQTKSMSRIALSEETFELLSKVMNDIHDKEHSSRFWKIFLGNHVSILTNIWKEDDPDDIESVSPHSRSVYFSLRLRRVRFRDLWVQHAKYLLNLGNRSKRKKIIKEFTHITLGFSDIQQLFNENKSCEFPSYYPVFWTGGDAHKRRKVQEIAEKKVDAFPKNALKLLPGIAIEYFQKLYGSIELVEPEKKVFHVKMLRPSVYDSLFIAKYVEHGSKLVWYQEGAECVENRPKYCRYYHYNVSDEYRTWGWKIKEKDVPGKAYPLIKFRSEYSKYKREDLFDLFMCFPKLRKENRAFYKSTLDYLLDNLKVNDNYSIFARPYPVNSKKSNKRELDFIESDLVTKSSGLTPIAEEISKSNLVLQLEIPSTNFLECIIVNHPTVGLLLNEHPTKIIRPYYEFFLEKGMLHQDVQSLVRFLNQTDIKEWWNEIMNEAKMQEFKNKFAGGP